MSARFSAGYRDHVLGRDGGAVALWYPCAAQESAVKYRGYPGSAAKKADIADGRHPLIVISHGTLGHRFCHCWLAEILARAGFVVAALQHDGDNVTDGSIARTPAALAARPKQVSDMLDRLLAVTDIASHLDRDRIALIGHSVGGYTCLALLGAEPDMGKLFDHCRSHPQDVRTCERMPLDAEAPVLPDGHDPRFGSALIMMPAYGPAFEEEDFDLVEGRVHVISAPDDEVIPDGLNAVRIAELLGERAELTVIDGAGHYSSMPVCTPLLQRDFPALCVDFGMDRAQIHEKIAESALNFFSTLAR